MLNIVFICTLLVFTSAQSNIPTLASLAILRSSDAPDSTKDCRDACDTVSAQEDISTITPMLPYYKTEQKAPDNQSRTQLLIDHTYQLSVSLLLFSTAMMLLMAYLLYLKIPASSIMRVFGTFTIICIATFLVIAGYSETQIAPIIGLFGTVIGYILGKTSSSNPPDRVP